MNYTQWFEENSGSLQRTPFLSNDNPTFENPSFDRASMKVLIVRLSPFADVDRSTPHLFLFSEVRKAVGESFIDMAFFPSLQERKRLQEQDIPLLLGRYSHRTADEFDLVLISNSFLLELINLPYLFLHSSIPLWSSEREGWPLFILGGSNSMAAQAIVNESGDSLVDAIFFGEGEHSLSCLIEACSEIKKEAKSKSKKTKLQQKKLEGLWVSTGESPERQVVKAVARDFTPAPTVHPSMDSEEAGTGRLQIAMGCPSFCNFCFEGYDRKPYREIPLDALLQQARSLKRQGCSKLELYSFNFNTYSRLIELFLRLNRLFDIVTFKSQRVDILYTYPLLLDAQLIAGKKVFTLGIEGISERQRTWLHKSLTAEMVEEVARNLLQHNIREMKLFYLFTGYEEEGDWAEFARFAQKLKAWHKLSPGTRILFSFGFLVRMPRTPLQYDRILLNEEKWKPTVHFVESTCKSLGFEFRSAMAWPDYVVTQIMALGGYWLNEYIIRLAREGNCFEQSVSPEYMAKLKNWLKQDGHWEAEWLGEKPKSYRFPFDFVKSAPPAKFLYRMYEEAQEGKDSGYCLALGENEGKCLSCSSCKSEREKKDLVRHVFDFPTVRYELNELEETMSRKRRLKPVYARFRVPFLASGAWLNAWAMRSVLRRHPALIESLLSVEESLFGLPENRNNIPCFFGETVFSLKAWDTNLLHQELSAPVGKAPGELEFVSFCPDFKPGYFREMTVRLSLDEKFFPQAEKALVDLIRSHHVTCNVRKESEGYRLDIPKEDKKKRFVTEGWYRKEGGMFEACLKAGHKFSLERFFAGYERAGTARFARVEVSELIE